MYRDVGECWVEISTVFSFLSVGRPSFRSAIFLASSFSRFFFYFPHLAVTSLVFIPSRPVYFLFFFIVRYMYIGLDQLRSILHCPPSGRYVLFLPTKTQIAFAFLSFALAGRPAKQKFRPFW
jgi:hypothetical protein